MKTALIIVDVQNDYFPGGKNELVNAVQAATQVKKLLDHFRSKQMPVIHVQHLSVRPGATFFLPGTPGAEIRNELKPVAGEEVIVKHYPNSFRETRLREMLAEKEIERLVICGMMSHMCVDSTVRAAFDYGYDCLLANDACTTKNLRFGDAIVEAGPVHSSFMAALNGTFARVAGTEEMIRQLENHHS